jgi:uncharacterized Zn finger protein
LRREKHLYRCKECGNVSYHLPEKEVTVRAIISSGESSEVGKITLKESEVIEVKDELVIEVDEGFKIGQVTSIELANGKRVDKAEIKDVATLWLRDTGEVNVKISVHKGRVTIPFEISVPGETEFQVDEILEITNNRCKITKIKLDDGKILDIAGRRAKSKNIKRIYAVLEKRRKRKRW